MHFKRKVNLSDRNMGDGYMISAFCDAKRWDLSSERQSIISDRLISSADDAKKLSVKG